MVDINDRISKIIENMSGGSKEELIWYIWLLENLDKLNNDRIKSLEVNIRSLILVLCILVISCCVIIPLSIFHNLR